MINSTKTTKISSIFLAAILVAGTITAVYPSFVIGAEAQSETYYGVDRYKQSYGKDNYKSKDSSSAIVQKVKCNNIDVNVNGLEITALPPSLSGLLTDEAQATDEGERGSSYYGSGKGSYGSGGQSGSDKDFKFVCINNNNPVIGGGGGGEEEPIPEPDLACEECFAANSMLQTAILDTTANIDEGDSSTFSISTVDGEGDIIAEVFIISSETDTIENLCAQIENAVENFGVPMSDTLLRVSLSFLLDGVPEGGPSQAAIDDLIECILEKGIIVHRDFLPYHQ